MGELIKHFIDKYKKRKMHLEVMSLLEHTYPGLYNTIMVGSHHNNDYVTDTGELRKLVELIDFSLAVKYLITSPVIPEMPPFYAMNVNNTQELYDAIKFMLNNYEIESYQVMFKVLGIDINEKMPEMVFNRPKNKPYYFRKL